MKNKKLEAYTRALLAEVEFRTKHRKLIDEFSVLKLNIGNTEAELKKEVRENVKTDISNDRIRVTYSPVYKKSYNFDIIMARTTPKQKKALEEANAIKRTLDKEKFLDLVEKGIIPVEVKQDAFVEKESTAQVRIKENQPE